MTPRTSTPILARVSGPDGAVTTLRLPVHAINQYRERRPGPEITFDAAIVELRQLVARAHLVGQRTTEGGTFDLWRVSGSGRKQGDRWRFRVVAGSVVTVLPPHDGRRKGRA